MTFEEWWEDNGKFCTLNKYCCEETWAACAEQKDKRIAELEAENDKLRGLLGNSSKDCPYCGLPAADQAKCEWGFPGCARSDDQLLSKHFADGWALEMCQKELIDEQAKLDALRQRIAELEAELAALKAPQEPVAEMDYKSPYVSDCIRWLVTHRPPHGTELYARPVPAPECWKSGLIREAIATLKSYGQHVSLCADLEAMLAAAPTYKGEG